MQYHHVFSLVQRKFKLDTAAVRTFNAIKSREKYGRNNETRKGTEKNCALKSAM